MAFSTNPSSRPSGGGGASPRSIFSASSSIVVMPPPVTNRRPSVRPPGVALDLQSVGGAAFDQTIGPVLNAQEVQGLVRVVAPGPCRRRGEAQDRAFPHV